MEKSVALCSTGDSIQQIQQFNHIPYHKKTKTSDFPSKKRSPKKRIRHLSEGTDSTTTLIDNQDISSSLNNYKLKLSLKSIYDSNPAEKLKEIFSNSQYRTPKILPPPDRIKLQFTSTQRRRRYKVDSIFEEKEAEMIREELNSIKSPQWQIFHADKKKPSHRRTSGSILHKSKEKKQKSPVMTRASSLTSVEPVTFLEETSQDSVMTDDWHKSLLFKSILGKNTQKLPMTEQEITVLARKPPREGKSIQIALEKGFNTLKILLMEMLGTKEDMERFEARYNVISPGHVKALMEKCLDIIKVRKETSEVIQVIIDRENIMKSLEISNNRVKEKVVKVYRLNKIIREKIEKWLENKNVPFEEFVFKGKNYLQKISEDSVILQGYLSSPYVLYTQYQ